MTASAQRTSAKISAAKSGRILALDYGRTRIGLALSDELALTSQPAGALARTNRRDVVTHLRALVRKNNVRQIIIGLPLHLDGTQSEMSAEVQRFAARLRKHLGIPIGLVDERLTSWDAANDPALARAKKNRVAKSSGDRDAIAAAIILRDYLVTRAATSRQQQQSVSRLLPPPENS